jgi:hypothetical protein
MLIMLQIRDKEGKKKERKRKIMNEIKKKEDIKRRWNRENWKKGSKRED